MAFSISFMNAPPEYPYEDASTEAARGLILIGNFREEFLSNLREWTQAEYLEQWSRSTRSLLEGERKAVLITTFSSPTIATHLEWWALYREGEHVFVQNHLLFYKDVDGEFNVNHAAEYLRNRQTVNDEGIAISEWCISMDDLRAFAEAGGPRS